MSLRDREVVKHQPVVQCVTCGVEHSRDQIPEVCAICADERQYVPAAGQQWQEPSAARIELVEREPGLVGLVVHDGSGIGQQAKVVVTEQGTVMVDVPASITEVAVAEVRALGPMVAIIPSHPHMFGLMSLWSEALGGVPVWVPEVDARWLAHQPKHLELWSGIRQPLPGVSAAQPGGHFPGSAVVHWVGRDDAGVLLAGDTIFVNPDLTTASFMRSYPNRLPLSADIVRRIARDVARWEFERLYSNFEAAIGRGARQAVLDSAERHASWVLGEHDDACGPGIPA